MSSYFYLQADKNSKNASFLEKLQVYAEAHKELIYVLNRPLTDQKYTYRYSDALIVLSPKHKIAIIDCGRSSDGFDDYVEDVIEDIGSISDKYLYKEVIGRPRQWRQSLVVSDIALGEIIEEEQFFQELFIDKDAEIKKIDLLISLFIGSINDIDRVKE